MADFVTGGLLVPSKNRLVEQGTRRRDQFNGQVHQAVGRIGTVGQAQQPIGRNLQGLRAVGGKLGVGQAGAGRQQGRNRRTVGPGGTRERALGRAVLRHRLSEAQAKPVGAVAFVDHIRHMGTIRNFGDDMVRILWIPEHRRKWYSSENKEA